MFKITIWLSVVATVVESFDSLSHSAQKPEGDFGVSVEAARCGNVFTVDPPDRKLKMKFEESDQWCAAGKTPGTIGVSVGGGDPGVSPVDQSTSPIVQGIYAGTDMMHTVDVYGGELIRCVARQHSPSTDLNADYSNGNNQGVFSEVNSWNQRSMDDIFCMEERNPTEWDPVLQKPKSKAYAVLVNPSIDSVGSVGQSDFSYTIFKVVGSNKFVEGNVVFTKCGVDHYRGCCGLQNMTASSYSAPPVEMWGGWKLQKTNSLR